MLAEGIDNRFIESPSPHSLGLKNNLTIPNPGFDSNPLLIYQKQFWGAGLQGGCGRCNGGYGLGGLTFDGTGLLGTGLFSGDITTWGVGEAILGIIGIYMLYSSIHQAKQHKYRLEGARRRQRVSKAKRLREQAKRLEEKTEGIF